MGSNECIKVYKRHTIRERLAGKHRWQRSCFETINELPMTHNLNLTNFEKKNTIHHLKLSAYKLSFLTSKLKKLYSY